MRFSVKVHPLKPVKKKKTSKEENKRIQQISTEGVQGETWLGRQGDPLGKVQENSIRPYK